MTTHCTCVSLACLVVHRVGLEAGSPLPVLWLDTTGVDAEDQVDSTSAGTTTSRRTSASSCGSCVGADSSDGGESGDHLASSRPRDGGASQCGPTGRSRGGQAGERLHGPLVGFTELGVRKGPDVNVPTARRNLRHLAPRQVDGVKVQVLVRVAALVTDWLWFRGALQYASPRPLLLTVC